MDTDLNTIMTGLATALAAKNYIVLAFIVVLWGLNWVIKKIVLLKWKDSEAVKKFMPLLSGFAGACSAGALALAGGLEPSMVISAVIGGFTAGLGTSGGHDLISMLLGLFMKSKKEELKTVSAVKVAIKKGSLKLDTAGNITLSQ